MGWVVLLGVGLTARVAGAQLMAPRQQVEPGSSQSRALASGAAEALVAGKPAEALQRADQAIAADARDPWAHYDRAAALTDLGRVDEAVAEFKVAQTSFSAQDPWGRSIAIYGRANALAQAGRCGEARPAFEEYAVFVERSDPPGAGLARSYATQCQPRALTPRAR